jgi:hypothetical protein
MTFLWSPDFATCTVSAFSSAQATAPATNVLNYARPNRPWRTTGISGAESVTLDTGATAVIDALVIHHTNAASVDVLRATAAGGPFVSIGGAPFATALDVVDGYRKCYVPIGGAGTQRYLRVALTPNAVTDGTTSYFVGSVIVLRGVQTFPLNPQSPMNMTRTVPTYRAQVSGREEVYAAGDGSIEITWEQQATEASLAMWQTVGLLDPDRPFILYRNRGKSQEAYLVRIDATVSHGFISADVLRLTLNFKQVV